MKIKSIKPRKNQVFIRQESVDRVDGSGIITPDSVEMEQKAYGEVLAVGPSVEDIKKGDKVIFGYYSGEKIEIHGEDKDIFRLVPDDEVLAFIFNV